MSVGRDLKHNRKVYKMLSVGYSVSGNESDFSQQDMWDEIKGGEHIGYDDGGRLDDAVFVQKMQSLQQDDRVDFDIDEVTARDKKSKDALKPVRYALDRLPVEFQDNISRSVRREIVPSNDHIDSPTVFPSLAPIKTAENDEDMLDVLLKRLETNARQYPQDLSGRG